MALFVGRGSWIISCFHIFELSEVLGRNTEKALAVYWGRSLCHFYDTAIVAGSEQGGRMWLKEALGRQAVGPALKTMFIMFISSLCLALLTLPWFAAAAAKEAKVVNQSPGLTGMIGVAFWENSTAVTVGGLISGIGQPIGLLVLVFFLVLY